VLAQRNGRPFVEPTAEQEDVAAIATAFHLMLSSSPPGDARAAVERRWKSQARAEGLREQETM
jgi:cytochrome c-type biogenesis protein CcmH/NrfG